MMPLSRVVWTEGMHLSQHHFQAQSRYFEAAIGFALTHLFFKSYGLAGCELDAEALRNGTLSLIHARGVMPDGLPFHFPEGDPPPEAREIKDLFSPTQNQHLVWLAIPPFRPGHPNTAEPGENGREARYVSESSDVFDETTGRDNKPVDVARKNFRLLLDFEMEDDLVGLPLARAIRDGSGQFVYDSSYIPPCLQIGASPRLMELLSRTIEILEAKAASLMEGRSGEGKSLSEYAAHEVASFWLLHAVQSSLAPLRHHRAVKRSHPESLYREMVRLAGALCTFSLQSHPRDLPAYDHDHLEEVFDALDRHIRSHLEVIIPKSSVKIPLARERPLLHVGQIADKRCFGASEWVLGVRSSLSEAQVIAGVPKLVKVCSSRVISRVVKEARAALPLTHVPVPPADISPRIGTQYFRLDKQGPCWEAIQRASDVAIYVPDTLAEAELELQVILEDQS